MLSIKKRNKCLSSFDDIEKNNSIQKMFKYKANNVTKIKKITNDDEFFFSC
jgi:hypothetical protein